MSQIRVDDLVFELRRSEGRKAVEITVDREGCLILSAPSGADDDRLRSFVRSKRRWIYAKLAEREKYATELAPKRYLEGEGFLYLGRSYRLRLVEGQAEPLRFSGGRFLLERSHLADARSCFVTWYSERARRRMSDFVDAYASRMRVDVNRVVIQDLGYRWGSCGKGQRLYFHWKTILLPSRIVEYIAVHELAHLREAHHTPEFWLAVERAMPDFERRRDWLAERGAAVENAI